MLENLLNKVADYEEEPNVLAALRRAIPQLKEFYSSNFTMLKSVYQLLATSPKLEGFLLDLSAERDPNMHYTTGELGDLLRDAFHGLQKIVLQGDIALVGAITQHMHRRLHHIDLRLEGGVGTDGLADIIQLLDVSSTTLQTFRFVSAELATTFSSRTMAEALRPLRTMRHLQGIHIEATFSKTQMLNDAELGDLLRRWPKLRTFVLSTEPGGWHAPPSDGTGPHEARNDLTLSGVLQHAAQSNPDFIDLTLPFVSLAAIPSLPPDHLLPRSYTSRSLTFSRCHVPDKAAVTAFVEKIWPNAEVHIH
jgi:hypothetical protein